MHDTMNHHNNKEVSTSCFINNIDSWTSGLKRTLSARGGFAAERRAERAGDIDRQRRPPGAQQQRRRSTAPSSKCEQCHVDS